MPKNEDTADALHPGASRQLPPEACKECRINKSTCDGYTPCDSCLIFGRTCVREEEQLGGLISGPRPLDILQVENRDLGHASEKEGSASAKKPMDIPTPMLQQNRLRAHQKGRSENTDDFVVSSIGYSTHDPNVGFVETLYQLCSVSLVQLWKSRRRLMPQGAHRNTLKKDVADLGMWAQCFPTGYLDFILEKSDHLRMNAIENLVEVGKIISSLSSSPERDTIDAKEDNHSREIIGHELKTALEKANIILASGGHSDAEEDSELSSDETSEDSSSNSDHEQNCYGRLHCYISCMVNLIPVIEEQVSCLKRKEEAQNVPVGVYFYLSQGAQPYAMRIRDRFVHTPAFLVERLAEANWERFLHIGQLHEEGTDDENNEDTATIFKPRSLFRDSALGSSVPAHSGYAPTVASHSSFISIAEDEGQGRPRVPPLPAQGKIFQCDYCLKNVSMRDRIEWKIHVFEDLHSYVCTHPECKDALTTFRNRDSWAKHEFDEHFNCLQWRCFICKFKATKKSHFVEHVTTRHETTLSGHRLDAAIAEAQETAIKPEFETYQCPLCSQTGWKTRKSYATHMGRHLEEVSLASLPREEEEYSDISSNVDGSGSGYDRSHKQIPTEQASSIPDLTDLRHRERLPTIQELLADTNSMSRAVRGPIPATTPLVRRQDANGVQWLAFEYLRENVNMEYTIRCDVESVNVDTLSQDFKTENCVYPRAWCSKEDYKDDRLVYETECNAVGWAIADLNPALRGKRGLIQRAVDSWRNSNQDPRLRSRRVRREAKTHDRQLPQTITPQPPVANYPTGPILGGPIIEFDVAQNRHMENLGQGTINSWPSDVGWEMPPPSNLAPWDSFYFPGSVSFSEGSWEALSEYRPLTPGLEPLDNVVRPFEVHGIEGIGNWNMDGEIREDLDPPTSN